MLSYHCWLIQQVNKRVDMLKNVSFPPEEAHMKLQLLTCYLREIQYNMRGIKPDGEMWNAYVKARKKPCN